MYRNSVGVEPLQLATHLGDTADLATLDLAPRPTLPESKEASACLTNLACSLLLFIGRNRRTMTHTIMIDIRIRFKTVAKRIQNGYPIDKSCNLERSDENKAYRW